MSLKVGIVGLPNVGKSTLFNAITNLRVEAANYPFATIEPNVGVVPVPDNRINKLVEIANPEKVIQATIEIIDIAGLVEGSSKGEGLGNKFLANIREVDAILHVVRCFKNDNITHVIGSVNPIRDAEIINLELILADLETVKNVLERAKRKGNTDEEQFNFERNLLNKAKETLESEKPIRSLGLTPEEKAIIKGWHLLTFKPMVYVANVGDDDVTKPSSNPAYMDLANKVRLENNNIIAVSAQIEYEISKLSDEEKVFFLNDIGLKLSGLDQVVRASFDLLGLSTYFTVGKKEVRAWTFKKGMSAPQCAGIIHTDFERGFIKAEVIKYDHFVAFNGEHGAKNNGKMQLEGKDYIMQDGDIVHFKFNV